MPPKNDRILRALRLQETDCTPVWIMRQAGRYLPEYRKTRARAGDFMTLCKTPELACEVTLQPLRRFALDAAILFSDILTIPDAMGLGLSFDEGVGPRFAKRLQTRADIDALPGIDAGDDLHYVLNAVRLVRRELDGAVPLIGFSGSPWTLAAYMVEGGSSKDFRRARALLHADPQSAHRLLGKLSRAVADYLAAQAAAGAQALMIFDTWGGLLSTPDYAEFSLRCLRAIVAELKAGNAADIPVTLFTKGGGNWLEDIAATGCAAVGLDWHVSLADARGRIGDRAALQGNLDPAALYASEEKIEAEVKRIIGEFGPGPGHLFNLGHGIYPDTDPARVAYLVDAVHRLSGADASRARA
ncbi:MAG: uroporphyrinogen decarboxylase [Gammaproteobacteria bacterium]|nr:uroporphyrinogen decarboxylase [Gammaproteobacteria bacterium]